MWGGVWGRLTLHQCLRSEILTDPRPFSQILLRCADAVGAPVRGIKPDLFLSDERAKADPQTHPGRIGRSPTLSSASIPDLPATPATCRAKFMRTSHLKFCGQTDCGLVLTGTGGGNEIAGGLAGRGPAIGPRLECTGLTRSARTGLHHRRAKSLCLLQHRPAAHRERARDCNRFSVLSRRAAQRRDLGKRRGEVFAGDRTCDLPTACRERSVLRFRRPNFSVAIARQKLSACSRPPPDGSPYRRFVA